MGRRCSETAAPLEWGLTRHLLWRTHSGVRKRAMPPKISRCRDRAMLPRDLVEFEKELHVGGQGLLVSQQSA